MGIHSVYQHFDGGVAPDPPPQECLVVGSAHDLQRRAPGDLPLETPQLCVTFAAQQPRPQGKVHPRMLRQLILQIDAAPVDNQRIIAGHEVLRHHDVTDMHGVKSLSRANLV